MRRIRRTQGDAAYESAGPRPGVVDTTRALFTLVGAAIAGFLVWLASYMDRDDTGEYWAAMGFLAAAGLVMALSQLFGGWTKWGWPRISPGVFLLGLIPVAIGVGWVLLATQPDGGWQQGRFEGWSGDVGVTDLVRDVGELAGVLAFGLGLVFGFTFDTTGPRVRRVDREHVVDRVADEPTTAERAAVATTPRTRTDDRELAGTPVAPQPAPPRDRDVE